MNTLSTHGDKMRQQILDFLEKKTESIAPVSYKEIAVALGFASTNTVEHHLKILEGEGKIKLINARNIKVTK